MPDFEDSRVVSAAPSDVWSLVSDRQRLPDWVPTIAASHAEGEHGVEAQGESHGHTYDAHGNFDADDSARRLQWDSARYSGYRGELTVTESDSGSRVAIRVSVPEAPPGSEEEMKKGITETLDRIEQLSQT